MPRKIARTEDFRQLEFLFSDHIQWSYELIRPIALFEDITIKERSQETGRHPKTINKHLRRFRRKGMLGLFPEWEKISHLSRKKRVPEEIKKEILKLKGLYQGLHNYELARIIFIKFGYPISHSTVKKIIEENRYRIQPELQLTHYHDFSDPYQARLKVVRLYYCGWSKNSIALFFGLSGFPLYPGVSIYGTPQPGDTSFASDRS